MICFDVHGRLLNVGQPENEPGSASRGYSEPGSDTVLNSKPAG